MGDGDGGLVAGFRLGWVSKLIRKRHDSSVTSVSWHPDNGLNQEPKSKVYVLETALLNIAEFVSRADQKDFNLSIPLTILGLKEIKKGKSLGKGGNEFWKKLPSACEVYSMPFEKKKVPFHIGSHQKFLTIIGEKYSCQKIDLRYLPSHCRRHHLSRSEHTHSCKEDRTQWVDEHSRKTRIYFKSVFFRLSKSEGGVTNPPPVSEESIWIEIVGGKRRGRVYDMGEVRDSSMMQP
ncbi:hypothetical protein Ahy_A05g024310 [Arachis hypogaea]|uniref:Uncharacterized protein n=1 Tax=Arachis hypogaea TaxID=3818 RepID=A0A445D683_ARAHY|nr:hypothetical protein Ahy_A05g024310 [Arachis hypogaea]